MNGRDEKYKKSRIEGIFQKEKSYHFYAFIYLFLLIHILLCFPSLHLTCILAVGEGSQIPLGSLFHGLFLFCASAGAAGPSGPHVGRGAAEAHPSTTGAGRWLGAARRPHGSVSLEERTEALGEWPLHITALRNHAGANFCP